MKTGILKLRGRTVDFPRRPLVMGIVNINDDSFCGDGKVDAGWALERAGELVRAGADIIDVGGESARTNRQAIREDEEWKRVRPFVEGFADCMSVSEPRDGVQVFPPILSINTWRAGVARRSLEAGGELLNDMSGLPDATNARICAETGAALLIMHTRGAPKVAHTHVTYDDVIGEIRSFFEEKIRLAVSAGLDRERIVIDPGIDFAKQQPDNLRVFRELGRLEAFGCPVLLPVSRKSVIGQVLGIDEPSARDAGTVACIVAGILRGAAIFRVHSVDAAWHSIRAMEVVV
jgi:dihydropteroate synthase